MSITTPEVDTDFTVLEDLEFETPCDLPAPPFGDQCTRPARWVMTIGGHCKPNVHDRIVICGAHRNFILDGAMVECADCGEMAQPRDFIIRLEPLKPTTGDHQ